MHTEDAHLAIVLNNKTFVPPGTARGSQTDNFAKCTREKHAWPFFFNNKLLFFLELCKEDLEGVVAQWCNPLTLQPEQSGGVGSSPGRAPLLERHDKGSRTRLGLLYFCDPSAWR